MVLVTSNQAAFEYEYHDVKYIPRVLHCPPIQRYRISLTTILGINSTSRAVAMYGSQTTKFVREDCTWARHTPCVAPTLERDLQQVVFPLLAPCPYPFEYKALFCR